jgi:hypothetical protein
MAGAGHAIVGRTGPHMLLQALSLDSAVRLCHDFNWESRGGAHRVAPKVVPKVKA